jgi:hypothetical protein
VTISGPAAVLTQGFSAVLFRRINGLALKPDSNVNYSDNSINNKP